MGVTHAGDVFTIALHKHNNYPAVKPPSSIDVDLPDGVGDDDYLAWLDNALSSGLRQFEPDLLCYIAGADPYRSTIDRKSTRLNSSHQIISYAVFCLKKKK